MKKLYVIFYIIIFLISIFLPTNYGSAKIVCTPPETLSTDGSSCVSPPESPAEYILLQPLPCKADEPSCEDGKLTTFDPDGTGKLGEYLNLMINLFIGLCAVTAVIMIVMGGIEYSTSDLVSSKAAAKDRIQNAILGLLLALCSWLILNTINPDLLNTDIDIGGASIESEEEELIGSIPNVIPSDTGAVPAGPSGKCTSGVEKGKNGIVACKDVLNQLDAMIDAARAAGINLSGGGFRTAQQQIDTRIRNCGGNTYYNIYQKPAKLCSPPTAQPGTSRHESGTAVDFNCNGSTIKSRTSPCFRWLAANAARFGYYNFPKEPWHWSRDGR